MNATPDQTDPARLSVDPTIGGPRLTTSTLRRWLPPLAKRIPPLGSAYLVPGRVSPRLREATMLGVTSVNRCAACARVHERWARTVGLPVGDPLGFTSDQAAAYRFGQSLASMAPGVARPPVGLGARHRAELEAVGMLMELANLAGNRFLAAPGRERGPGPKRPGSHAAPRLRRSMHRAFRAISRARSSISAEERQGSAAPTWDRSVHRYDFAIRRRGLLGATCETADRARSTEQAVPHAARRQ